MVQFNKLRLAGFKSFVEPSELLIEPGLTGVVGPNGCGKSNLIDALRWVMAENSAKEMRGGEMDDVIFGGTSDRPSRNIAEVTLVLENDTRDAPASFNGDDTIEVTRRIERGEGSLYRVNGRDVRARDVSLLFADVASGARSTAIVTQGRVGSLVAARPADRRALLEEAAGITGLHGRRHEAELRLRAAETNLQRLEDVIVTLDQQLDALKKQARQASRYRNISGHIRKTEAGVLHRRWRECREAVENARVRLASAASRVADMTATAAGAATAQADLASNLPPLRDALVAAQAAHHRVEVELSSLAAEERRIEAQQAELAGRKAQIEADKEREQALAADARAARERLSAEKRGIEAARTEEETLRASAEGGRAAAAEETRIRDEEFAALTSEIAAAEARRAELTRRAEEARERTRRFAARAEELAREIAAIERVPPEELARAERDVADARAALAAAEAAVAATGTRRGEAEARATAAREALQATDAATARLAAEESALARLLKAAEQDMWPPVIDRISVDAGYETALGAALADDLLAPADEGAAVHWRSLPSMGGAPSLPGGVTALAAVVRAPDALARRLSQIGVVPDAESGAALAGRLVQGQRLVSRDGALWRWDGFTVKAGTATAAATRLEQRNRLADVRGQKEGADRARAEAAAANDTARGALAAAVEDAREAEATLKDARATLDRARDAHGELSQRAAAQDARAKLLAATASQAASDEAESRAAADGAAGALAQLGDGVELRAHLDAARSALAQARTALAERQSAADRLAAEARVRGQRLAVLAEEDGSWAARMDGAEQRLTQLDERLAAAVGEIARLSELPAEIARRRDALAEQLSAAEGRRREAGDAVAAAENALAEADRRLKGAEAALSESREDRVRAEAAVEQAQAALGVVVERIAERLSCAPEAAFALAEVEDEAELPDMAHLEGKLDRLLRERDNMGAVNLRAEEEADELTTKIETMRGERDDLLAAIARLRDGIAELNREGRERLLASFEAVNQHFQTLFTRMFNGGSARLMLTDQDNPLEAGLEIMASPPGKRTQVLSLLSGGERALTALALLFAVFLTNPAPICVLDEVDAPLDDANVDRLCLLLEEISHQSATRFLVVTHHRMTMARMDRLFGVTMPEAGVSQLVSVDLERAERLRDETVAA